MRRRAAASSPLVREPDLPRSGSLILLSRSQALGGVEVLLDKRDVWLNGGPVSGQSNLSEGYYFFAVLSPGGTRASDSAAAIGVIKRTEKVRMR